MRRALPRNKITWQRFFLNKFFPCSSPVQLVKGLYIGNISKAILKLLGTIKEVPVEI